MLECRKILNSTFGEKLLCWLRYNASTTKNLDEDWDTVYHFQKGTCRVSTAGETIAYVKVIIEKENEVITQWQNTTYSFDHQLLETLSAPLKKSSCFVLHRPQSFNIIICE